MIKIIQNQSNTTIFTLTEKTSIINANYLLKVFSNQNHDYKIMRLSGDTSANLARYNQFDIVESNSENLNAGIISLIPGTYDYFVYETSGATLSLTGATIVESGKMKVSGTGTTSSTFINNNNEITFE